MKSISDTLMLAHVLKLIRAISTKQTGLQLIELLIEGPLQAATRQAQRRAADHNSFLSIPAR
jgi:hypothetical protein